MENMYIGLIYDYSFTDTCCVTLKDLQDYIKESHTIYTLSDYLDRRKSMNMQRFNYCPFTGKKIDWKKLKAENCYL